MNLLPRTNNVYMTKKVIRHFDKLSEVRDADGRIMTIIYHPHEIGEK